MIDILKTITQKKIGFKIKNYNDSIRLSDIIFMETGIELNYNTIRRFFGVVEPVKPSNFTLDALSRFNGYENYNDFLLNYSFKNQWREDFKFFELLQKNEHEIILDYVTSRLHHRKSFLLRFVQLIRELILSKNFELVTKIFSLNQMNPEKFIYDDIIYLGTCIGQLSEHFDLDQDNQKQLVLNENFQKLVILIYVDYKNLQGYYCKLISFIYENSNHSEIRGFCEGILNLDLYLSNKKKNTFFKPKIENQFHPILKSRIVAQTLFQPTLNHIKILENYSQKYLLNKKNNIDYFFEIIFNSIVTKNFQVMKWILDYLKEYSISKPFYKFEHYENFVLMKLLYFLKVNDRNSCEIWLESVSFENFNFSYEVILKQYVNIFKYHYYSIDKKIHLETYTKVSKNIYKDFFTKSYLLNYFES